jgi:SAM-dependent methyltransferase
MMRQRAETGAPPTTLPRGVFLCPNCHAVWEEERRCATCGFELVRAEGVPILVKDRAAVDAIIAEAKKAGRAGWYEAPQDEISTGAYRHHMRKRRLFLDAVIAAHVARRGVPALALDLGCGDGGQLGWLGSHAREIYGSDYNLLRLHRASVAAPQACIYMADILNYPVRDGTFDLIFFNHVLEHIPDDAAALAQAYRILKPGGLMLLGVPNEGAWFWQQAYRLQPAVLKASDHVHFYTADALAQKCRTTGFDVAHVEHIGWGVPHWSLDEKLRQWKAVDATLDWLGRRFFHDQATSLYLVLGKAA